MRSSEVAERIHTIDKAEGKWLVHARSEPAPSPQTGGTLEGIDKPVRYLGARIAGQSPASVFDTSAPVSPDRQDSFSNRFGNWVSSPAGSAPRSPYQPAPEDGSLTRGDAQNIRILSSRLISRDGVENGIPPPAVVPNQPGPLSQTGRPLGIFSGKPMPDYPLPPSIWGLDDSRAPGEDDENWYTRWRRLISPE
jgi:hypothetical protein